MTRLWVSLPKTLYFFHSSFIQNELWEASRWATRSIKVSYERHQESHQGRTAFHQKLFLFKTSHLETTLQRLIIFFLLLSSKLSASILSTSVVSFIILPSWLKDWLDLDNHAWEVFLKESKSCQVQDSANLGHFPNNTLPLFGHVLLIETKTIISKVGRIVWE